MMSRAQLESKIRNSHHHQVTEHYYSNSWNPNSWAKFDAAVLDWESANNWDKFDAAVLDWENAKEIGLEEIETYVKQARDLYNSAVSSYNFNVAYYTNRDRATYEANTSQISSLKNASQAKLLDIQRLKTDIQNNNSLITQKQSLKLQFLNNLSEQKLSHLLIKAIENNNVEVQDLVKVKDFDPSYNMKNGTGKYLLEVEITYNKQELFDLTMSKNPQITQEAKYYLLGIANGTQFFTTKLFSLNPIILESQDNLDLEEEMALLDINNREEIIETLGNDSGDLDHEII